MQLGAQTNSNKLNFIVIFICPVLGRKNFFWGILFQKKQNCLLKMKFATYTNSNMLNSMVMFKFSLLDWKHSFWGNWSNK